MRRDHGSDTDTVDKALRLDRERNPEPAQYHYLVAAVLAAWFLIVLTGSLLVRAWEVFHG